MWVHSALTAGSTSDQQVDLVKGVEDVQRVGGEGRCGKSIDGIEDCGEGSPTHDEMPQSFLAALKHRFWPKDRPRS